VLVDIELDGLCVDIIPFYFVNELIFQYLDLLALDYLLQLGLAHCSLVFATQLLFRFEQF
jgi:hypothetical protein